ncbi:hypothetical protein SAMN05192559_10753 [Halobacillus karajensis]|uniref:Uncharacterized protein n=1 Tax=Halobacillus karajensis TaxID=195088 RepID=A0A024PA07_9BACI|nr:hypothetical protein [Halobacillus karajensis]CDQ20105.1 hypothetical protein BN982_02420 [Halobacillus karajensis]CDQ25232.1 hypothetical protein BN983_03545 [Halobacillus karajensis]CDQ28407.1 hypothetical protein BN981_02707 [Halobacillus karajensis]SEI00670.1 hypothetical protein SAMN05192559_10753 [Halobacillus karajensis]
MGAIVMFLLLATVAPFLFLQSRKPAFAVVQSILLIGMWLYFFQVMMYSDPGVFSATWSMFYLGLIGAHVAWVMFIVSTVKSSPAYQDSLNKEKETLLS